MRVEKKYLLPRIEGELNDVTVMPFFFFFVDLGILIFLQSELL